MSREPPHSWENSVKVIAPLNRTATTLLNSSRPRADFLDKTRILSQPEIPPFRFTELFPSGSRLGT